MEILITGAAGQLGSDIVKELKKRDIEYVGVDVTDSHDIDVVDITDVNAVNAYFTKHKPQMVIHSAAYTAVDKAEDEPELCYKINAQGTENIAVACKNIGAQMIYISTDYVFSIDGDEPILTDAVKAPLSVYGKSKLAGEEAVQRFLDNYYIVRITWTFGQGGNNFVKTMLKLAQTKDELNVVNDQVGSPTYTVDLAMLLCDMALQETSRKKYGVYHATSEGYCSWAEFAAEIMRQSGSSCKINPITSDEYPTKAIRPKNSRLSKDCLDEAGLKRLPTWQNALSRFLAEIGNDK
ncbi:MAG: dTDP-4-dehydrorhamnose reductase [Oscillospiraceae bacterium]|jgi:dTDP-4-dehydrorhamnose reductase|nr:dTDP-4-dehydrorhamnose reductase [Oscillospiraceae bacterium]